MHKENETALFVFVIYNLNVSILVHHLLQSNRCFMCMVAALNTTMRKEAFIAV